MQEVCHAMRASLQSAPRAARHNGKAPRGTRRRFRLVATVSSTAPTIELSLTYRHLLPVERGDVACSYGVDGTGNRERP
jgi:hypothetical protein